MWSSRGNQRRGIDPAQLEEDQVALRWLFPVPPGCHTYHDHSNHDSSDTDQVELPGEELIDFFVTVGVLRQRSTPVSQPAFPTAYPSTKKGRSASPWSHLCPQVLAPGLPTRLDPSAPVSPLKQEQQRKSQMGTFNILLHHPQINEISTLYLFSNKSPNFLGSKGFLKQLC